jgi:hypothetical protein
MIDKEYLDLCFQGTRHEDVWVCVFYVPNTKYIDCLSLTYATNKGKMLKLHHKYKRKNNIQGKYKSPNDMK